MRWLLYFIPALLVELTAWVLTPIVCLFVVKRQHTDIVKRTYNKATVTLEREFLPDWLSYFGTPDNAVDEFWHGMYESSLINATSEEYVDSWWIRYTYRCLWLFRNTAYGFHYAWFSVPAEDETVTEYGLRDKAFWYRLRIRKSSWQLQYQIPLGKRYIDGNVGFKGHGYDRLMMANRLIGLRKYK
jgi:hypothetical protein